MLIAKHMSESARTSNVFEKFLAEFCSSGTASCYIFSGSPQYSETHRQNAVLLLITHYSLGRGLNNAQLARDSEPIKWLKTP